MSLNFIQYLTIPYIYAVKNIIIMKHHISSALALLSFLCISCNNSSKDIPPTITLTGEVINNSEPLSMPVIWAVDDSTAYLTSFSDRFLIDRFRLAGDSVHIIERIGKKGVGPLEMPYCAVSYSTDTKQLSLYNNNTKSIVTYDMSANADSCLNIDFTPNWPTGAVFHNISGLRNNDLLCTVRWSTDSVSTATSKPWFLRINHEDNTVHPVKGFDIEDNESVPIQTKGLLYVPNSRFARRPNHDQFVYTADNSRYLEIFTIENDSIRDRKIVLNQLPEYTVDSTNGMPRITSCETAYGIIPVATEKYIYCLMPRCTLNDLKQIMMGNMPDKFKGTACDYQFKGDVQVYDWDGNLIKTLSLNPMVINIMVSQDDRYIYGMSEDEDSETLFMRYPIPE